MGLPYDGLALSQIKKKCYISDSVFIKSVDVTVLEVKEQEPGKSVKRYCVLL